MKKKLLASICAGALTLALAVPALAAMETEFNATTTIPDGTGTVSVTVPAENGSLYISLDGAPYALKDATVGDYSVKGDTVTDGFFSDTGLIVNKSETELDVKVAMTATTGGNVTLTGTAGSGKLDLAGSLYVAEVEVDGTTVTPDWDNAEDITIAATVAATAAGTLPAAVTDDMGTTTNGILAYRLAGDVDVADDYSDDFAGSDSLAVTVVFTLTPATPGA